MCRSVAYDEVLGGGTFSPTTETPQTTGQGSSLFSVPEGSSPHQGPSDGSSQQQQTVPGESNSGAAVLPMSSPGRPILPQKQSSPSNI